MRKNLFDLAHKLVEFTDKEEALKTQKQRLTYLMDALQEFDIKLQDCYSPIQQDIRNKMYDAAYQYLKEQIAIQYELIGIIQLIKI